MTLMERKQNREGADALDLPVERDLRGASRRKADKPQLSLHQGINS